MCGLSHHRQDVIAGGCMQMCLCVCAAQYVCMCCFFVWKPHAGVLSAENITQRVTFSSGV